MNHEPLTLKEAFARYEYLKDAGEIALRAIKTDDRTLLENTAFSTAVLENTEKPLAALLKSAEEFAIIALWSAFERYLAAYLEEAGACVRKQSSDSFGELLYDKYIDETERWKPGDVLDLFKKDIDTQLLGLAKQIKRYRDYIAHRNPKKTPTKTDPEIAYAALSRLMQAMEDLK